MTSIEKFHWLDQNPEQPNYVFARLRFEIPLEPGLAQRALRLALDRQPLAYKQPAMVGRRWSWADSDAAKEYFEFQRLDSAPSAWEFNRRTSAFFTSFYLSLVEFPHGGATISEAQFSSHHAVSDGVASISLINDWLTIYNNLVAGQASDLNLHEIDQTRIEQRGQLGLTRWSYLRHLPNQLIACYGAAKFIFRKTANLAARESARDCEAERDFPAIVGRWVNSKDYKRSQAIARTFGVSYTSACLAACFAAIDRWNQVAIGKDERPSRRLWRILLPMSIRGRHDRTLPATNQTAIVQIDRCPRAEPDRKSLCQGIDREVNIIRDWQLEKMFLIAIRFASISNLWLKKIANNPDSRGAAIFTHLGHPFKRSNIGASRLATKFPRLSGRFARPVDFDLVGPIRSGTPINFSFARQDKRLKISLHYDRKLIPEKYARQLLEEVVNELSAD